MEKDFDAWNKKKKEIELYNRNKLYTVREIWWCSVGINIGSEQDGSSLTGSRPVLILKGMSKNTCLVAPLTTSLRKHKTRIEIGLVDNKQASVLLSQIKVVDTKRLTDKIGFLNKEIFEHIRKTIKGSL